MTLNSYLLDHSITEAAFAARVGVDQSTVHRWRKGQMPEGPSTMRAIARETGGKVTANDFFGIAA